jgi:hypothetical protein
MEATMWTTKAKITLGVGIAAALALVAWVVSHVMQKPMEVTGDPPVTVSDGSLHARSANGWLKDPDAKTIQPGPANGHLVVGASCKMATSAFLWADSKLYPISKGATVTIVHVPVSGSPAEVDIKVPSGNEPLTIKTIDGSFGSPGGNHNDRQHSFAGKVAQIKISDPSDTWKPADPQNPHYAVEFCYK